MYLVVVSYWHFTGVVVTVSVWGVPVVVSYWHFTGVVVTLSVWGVPVVVPYWHLVRVMVTLQMLPVHLYGVAETLGGSCDNTFSNTSGVLFFNMQRDTLKDVGIIPKF